MEFVEACLASEGIDQAELGRDAFDGPEQLVVAALLAHCNLVDGDPRSRPELDDRPAGDFGIVTGPSRQRVLDAGSNQSG
jgi:hypothetical protein